MKDFKKIKNSKHFWISEDGIIFNELKNIKLERKDKHSYITIDGNQVTKSIINLIYEAFIDEIPKGWYVVYKDGNKENTHYTNLILEQRQIHKIQSCRDKKRIDKETKLIENINKRSPLYIESNISYEGEIWVDCPIEGFTQYRISNFGRLRMPMKKQCIKIQVGVNGYGMYTRIYGDKSYSIRMHQAVAKLFLGDPLDDKMIVNHKDGNKLNNHVDNLEYVTYKSNFAHAMQNKLINFNDRKAHIKTGSYNKLFTDDEIKTIIELRQTTSLNKIAEQYKCSVHTIIRLLNNNGYKKENIDWFLYDSDIDMKSICMCISSELKARLKKISNEINKPLTEIFRHSLISFCNEHDNNFRNTNENKSKII